MWKTVRGRRLLEPAWAGSGPRIGGREEEEEEEEEGDEMFPSSELPDVALRREGL